MKATSMAVLMTMAMMNPCDSVGPGCIPLFASSGESESDDAGESGVVSGSDSDPTNSTNPTSSSSASATISSGSTSPTGGETTGSITLGDKGATTVLDPSASSGGGAASTEASTGGFTGANASSSETGGCGDCAWGGDGYCEGQWSKFADCIGKTKCEAGPLVGLPCAAAPDCWAICKMGAWMSCGETDEC